MVKQDLIKFNNFNDIDGHTIHVSEIVFIGSEF